MTGWLWKDTGSEGDARTSGLCNPDAAGTAGRPGGSWGGSDLRRVICSLVFEHIKL